MPLEHSSYRLIIGKRNTHSSDRTTDILASFNEVLKCKESEVVRSLKARLFIISVPRQISSGPVSGNLQLLNVKRPLFGTSGREVFAQAPCFADNVSLKVHVKARFQI